MPHTPRIPTPAGEQLDAAVEAKVGSASRDMWELREEMKHVMSGALAEHLRGLSATDREDDLVEKVAKFVGAMETRVVEELQGHVSATVANRLHSFVTPVDDQLEQLRALVMQSAKLHDVDAALERLHSLIALHGVTGALPRSAQAPAHAHALPLARRPTPHALGPRPITLPQRGRPVRLLTARPLPSAPPARPLTRPPPAHPRPRLASAVAKPPSQPLARSTPA